MSGSGNRPKSFAEAIIEKLSETIEIIDPLVIGSKDETIKQWLITTAQEKIGTDCANYMKRFPVCVDQAVKIIREIGEKRKSGPSTTA